MKHTACFENKKRLRLIRLCLIFDWISALCFMLCGFIHKIATHPPVSPFFYNLNASILICSNFVANNFRSNRPSPQLTSSPWRHMHIRIFLWVWDRNVYALLCRRGCVGVWGRKPIGVRLALASALPIISKKIPMTIWSIPRKNSTDGLRRRRTV